MRVLLVDDEPDILEQGKIFLKREVEELKVQTVASAEKALNMFRESDYDAVVADYKMPEMNGLELLKKVREEDDSIPFIILTDKGKEEIAMKALNWGADRYFRKTGTPRTVFSLLADSLKDLIRFRKVEERNKFLKFFFNKKIKNKALKVNNSLKKLKNRKIPKKEQKILQKAIKDSEEEIDMLEKLGKKEGEEGRLKERMEVDSEFIKTLEDSLGYAYWGESQIESDVWDVYKKLKNVEKYKRDFVRVIERAANQQDILENISLNLSEVDLKTSAEEIKLRKASFGEKTGKELFSKVLNREKFLLNIYEKLFSSTDKKLLKKIWKGETDDEYFKMMQELINGKKENLKLLKKIEKDLFPEGLPTSSDLSVNPEVFKL